MTKYIDDKGLQQALEKTKAYVDDKSVIIDTDLNTAITNIFGSDYSIL